MVWDKTEIIQTLKKLHRQGEDLSYNSMTGKMQSLVSAAAYHFGSYRIAIGQAGIDYADVARRPRWTKTAIIKLIKEAKRAGEPLHWSSVCKRRDELGKAGFAALQPRMFGSWDRALHAAGLDADEINQYRKWTRDTVVAELKARHRDAEPLNSGAIQKDDPEKVRQRKIWDRADVIKSLKAVKKTGKPVSDSTIRREHPALYGAAVRLFGSFTAARAASGFKTA
jgi:hypothetical protein